MDLKVHRAILFLALQRVSQRIDPNKSIIPPDKLLEQAFLSLWLGNWLTDMSQASAFFDVLDNNTIVPTTSSSWTGSAARPFQVTRPRSRTTKNATRCARWRRTPSA